MFDNGVAHDDRVERYTKVSIWIHINPVNRKVAGDSATKCDA